MSDEFDVFDWASEHSEHGKTIVEAYSAIEEDASAIMKLKDQTVDMIKKGEATFQDLGLLPSPPGEPEGGRWVFEERNQEVVYYPPGTNWHGHPIEEWPEWIPLGSNSSIPFILGDLYFRYKVSLEDVKQMAQMDPMSGVAPAGTDFGRLSPLQKRAYLANGYAIAAARNYANSGAYNAAAGALRNQQLNAGFKKIGTCLYEKADKTDPAQDSRLTYKGPPVCSDTGEPFTLTLGDYQVAAERLYAAMRGLVVPDSGARTAGQTPPVPQTGPGTECFGLTKDQCVSCIQNHNDPGVSELLDVCHRPYLAVHTPGKTFEYVVAPDKKGYLVLEMGGDVRGVRLLTALLAGGGALALGTISAGYYLFKTKKGKRLAKKLGLK